MCPHVPGATTHQQRQRRERAAPPAKLERRGESRRRGRGADAASPRALAYTTPLTPHRTVPHRDTSARESFMGRHMILLYSTVNITNGKHKKHARRSDPGPRELALHVRFGPAVHKTQRCARLAPAIALQPPPHSAGGQDAPRTASRVLPRACSTHLCRSRHGFPNKSHTTPQPHPPPPVRPLSSP